MNRSLFTAFLSMFLAIGAGCGTHTPGSTAGGSGDTTPTGTGGTPAPAPAPTPVPDPSRPPMPPAVNQFDSPCLSVPDPDVAAGPTLVATAIQWNAYFFRKDNGMMDHRYTWQALRGRLVSDTHIVYDVTTGKWFMTTIVSLGGGRFGVQFMVSTDENATDWKLSVPIEMPRLIDDPQPTITSDKAVITESGPCVWAVDKAALIAGDAPLVKEITCAVAQNNQVVAVKYGATVPATGYAVVMSDSTHINWLSVQGTPAAGDLTVTEHQVEVPLVDLVPLAGITQNNVPGLQSGQVKAMWQNNHIVWSKVVRCASGACVRAFDVDTAANTVKSDDFAMDGTQLFHGASALDKWGNMWLLMSATKPDGFVGLAIAGRQASGQLVAPTMIAPGLSGFPGNGGALVRFGDYAGSAQDPVDGSSWLINVYAAASGMGCKVVQVTAR
jgi:hypothetical protein